MVLQTATIARNTFLESIRQPIYMVIILLCGALLLLTTWGTGFSMGYSSSAEVSGDNKLLLDVGMATVYVSGMLLAAFVATAAVSREIENKTVLTVIAKPISRTSVILGKYAGVSWAMLIAVIPMLVFLLMGIRHGVMSTAADELDAPVLVFTSAAVGLALLLAAWANFFYGWPFSQTVVLALVPLSVVAYALVLVFGKEWKLQIGYIEHPILDQWEQPTGESQTRFEWPHDDFKPQILLASLAMAMSMLVLSAVAVAASTRLRQVMTIVVCCGVFLFGLLSNFFIGRHAYDNDRRSVIQTAEAPHPAEEPFRASGDTYRITLEWAPDPPMRVGDSFYYGDSPNGARLAVPPFRPFEGNAADPFALSGPGVDPGVVVTEVRGPTELTIRNVGATPARVSRPPRPGDQVFSRPTSVRPVPLALWAVIPNMQNFWLVDAVTQTSAIPASHIVRLALYGVGQVVALLSLAVILFQRRDVG
ncbi:MAG: ABC transporter permease [Phycisphaerales bacterium]|nr:ABC transporter permease [Phycisphaerales bacterium]MCB9841541.1 ABC transporter permease [Phycisphaeraceae bacterium]